MALPSRANSGFLLLGFPSPGDCENPPPTPAQDGGPEQGEKREMAAGIPAAGLILGPVLPPCHSWEGRRGWERRRHHKTRRETHGKELRDRDRRPDRKRWRQRKGEQETDRERHVGEAGTERWPRDAERDSQPAVLREEREGERQKEGRETTSSSREPSRF